jgi:hypothetical protein
VLERGLTRHVSPSIYNFALRFGADTWMFSTVVTVGLITYIAMPDNLIYIGEFAEFYSGVDDDILTALESMFYAGLQMYVCSP